MKKFFMEEQITQELQDRVFKAVGPELNKNRKRYYKKLFLILAPAFASVVFVVIVGLNYVEKTYPFAFEKESEVVVFPNHDIEFFENMDVIEHLDDLQAMDGTTTIDDATTGDAI